MSARLTHHAKDRGEQRLGLSAKSAERLAEMALAQGTTHAQTAGSLKRWLDGQAMRHGGALFRLYAESLFVFQGTAQKAALITVLKLPNEFKATLRKIRTQGANVQRSTSNVQRPRKEEAGGE